MRKIICALLLVAVVSLPFIREGVPRSVYANSTISFDDTDVLHDLMSSKGFNINNYPADSSGSLMIINFVEYGYSYHGRQGNYALYIYIYNPAALNISTASVSNMIQMATAYSAQGLPIDYHKFRLELRSMTENRLFYKFKVMFTAAQRTALLNRLSRNQRRYDISGVELMTAGSNNATEYHVGGTYNFSGFAAGYGADEDSESTLTATVRELETIEIRELHQTFFRSNISSKGANYRNQLNSVYFSICNGVLNRYGRLQKISATWWEYKTAPIVVTSDPDTFNKLQPHRGTLVNSYNSNIGYSLYHGYGSVAGAGTYLSWAYNPNILNSQWNAFRNSISNQLPLLFYTGGQAVDNYTLCSATLSSYIYNYNSSFHRGTLPIKNGNLSADLFSHSVDEGRTRGFNRREFDADSEDSKFNLLSYDSAHSGWQRFWQFGFSRPATDGDFLNVEPIKQVRASDIGIFNDSTIANNLLMNVNDVPRFRSFYLRETSRNRTVFLFRFAHTDYYSVPVEIQKPDTIAWVIPILRRIHGQAYMAKETVFADFDLIQMTFNRDGTHYVIPAVSSPIDIIPDIEPPLPDTESIWNNLRSGIRDLWEQFRNIVIIVFIAVKVIFIIFAIMIFVNRRR